MATATSITGGGVIGPMHSSTSAIPSLVAAPKATSPTTPTTQIPSLVANPKTTVPDYVTPTPTAVSKSVSVNNSSLAQTQKDKGKAIVDNKTNQPPLTIQGDTATITDPSHKFNAVTGAPNPNYKEVSNISSASTTSTTPNQIPPDPGQKTVYDMITGQREDVPKDVPTPAGYSDLPNTGPVTPVVDHTTTPSGNVIKKLNDGTYGTWNAEGMYISPATDTDFNNSKGTEGIQSSLAQMLATQQGFEQNEIATAQTAFQSLVQKQELANQNYTGGVTLAENLFGMGGQITGQAEIQSSINSGIQAINDMQVKQDAAIAAMKEGFNKDDNSIIQKEYDAYQHATDAKDAAVKDLNDTITQHNKDLQDFLDAKITEKQAAQNEADKVLQDAKTNAFEADTQKRGWQTLNDNEKQNKFDRWAREQELSISYLGLGLDKNGNPTSNGLGTSTMDNSQRIVDLSTVPAKEQASKINQIQLYNSDPANANRQITPVKDAGTLTTIQNSQAGIDTLAGWLKDHPANTKISDIAQGTPSTLVFGIAGVLGRQDKPDITKVIGTGGELLPDVKDLTIGEALEDLQNRQSNALVISKAQGMQDLGNSLITTMGGFGYTPDKIYTQLKTNSTPEIQGYIKTLEADPNHTYTQTQVLQMFNSSK